jgi:CDP-paratose 2-epimerase
MRSASDAVVVLEQMRILITGGAGFVGSHLALSFKWEEPDSAVVAFDNLKRRGSELALRRLAAGGVEFRHGDIRNPEDLADTGSFDLLVECSAEPSVQAGLYRGERYLINTNLIGTINCLDLARRHDAAVVFLSTSRVYPIASLRELPLVGTETRFVIPASKTGPGWSARGISESFPLIGSRSLYGATKLCAELIIAEYVALYGLRAVINRCGVLTGAWQMGKVDQGFVVLWAARHLFGGSLSYNGFGGAGLQVRDVLHVEDLYHLIRKQVAQIAHHSGKVYNVGGGAECSVSLAELTEACVQHTGRRLLIKSQPETNPVDIPFYITDNTAVAAATGWHPRISMSDILGDIFGWLRDHCGEVEAILK